MRRQCIPGRLSQLRAAWNRGYTAPVVPPLTMPTVQTTRLRVASICVCVVLVMLAVCVLA